MLPTAHQQRYADFKQQLVQLNWQMAEANWEQTTLQTAIQQLQQGFQTQILSLDSHELPPALEHQVQSYQVEMDKQLRLLRMDGLFLQAARQPATVGQRQQQVSDRLNTLIRYCDALLAIE